MEARDFAELLKEEALPVSTREYHPSEGWETRWGYGDADFFVETDDGTFLVTVAKVAE